MSEVEELQMRIHNLSSEDFSKLRDWFFELDADAWDQQIERDAKAGKLDALAQKALEDYAAGRTTPL